MSDMLVPPWPSFSQEEADCVSKVLLSNRVNYWTGDEGRNFEREFAAFAQTRQAIALSNGSVALEVALKAINIAAGDEIIVTPRSFIASASSVVLAGGVPVFADVDRDSQNITAKTIAPLITPRTRAIICVHLAGMPCEMDAIGDLAQAHDLIIIEDCAQAHGATYRGRSVGCLGDIGTWSFCQDKIMTLGGEGGMVTTSDEDLWSTMWSYKDHGKSWDAIIEPNDDSHFRWVHHSFGTNGRLTEMQSAIGRIQLTKMPQWHAARTANATAILDAARNCPGLRAPNVPNHMEHAWYKCYIFVEPSSLKSDWSRDRIIAEIRSEGAPCYHGSCSEIYLERAFADTDFKPSIRLPIAQELGETSLMFPVHPTMQQVHIDRIRDAITKVMKRATK